MKKRTIAIVMAVCILWGTVPAFSNTAQAAGAETTAAAEQATGTAAGQDAKQSAIQEQTATDRENADSAEAPAESATLASNETLAQATVITPVTATAAQTNNANNKITITTASVFPKSSSGSTYIYFEIRGLSAGESWYCDFGSSDVRGLTYDSTKGVYTLTKSTAATGSQTFSLTIRNYYASNDNTSDAAVCYQPASLTTSVSDSFICDFGKLQQPSNIQNDQIFRKYLNINLPANQTIDTGADTMELVNKSGISVAKVTGNWNHYSNSAICAGYDAVFKSTKVYVPIRSVGGELYWFRKPTAGDYYIRYTAKGGTSCTSSAKTVVTSDPVVESFYDNRTGAANTLSAEVSLEGLSCSSLVLKVKDQDGNELSGVTVTMVPQGCYDGENRASFLLKDSAIIDNRQYELSLSRKDGGGLRGNTTVTVYKSGSSYPSVEDADFTDSNYADIFAKTSGIPDGTTCTLTLYRGSSTGTELSSVTAKPQNGTFNVSFPGANGNTLQTTSGSYELKIEYSDSKGTTQTINGYLYNENYEADTVDISAYTYFDPEGELCFGITVPQGKTDPLGGSTAVAPLSISVQELNSDTTTSHPVTVCDTSTDATNGSKRYYGHADAIAAGSYWLKLNYNGNCISNASDAQYPKINDRQPSANPRV